MKMQLRLLVGCAALALAGLAFTGCGNDCATGTTEADGECAVDTKACGPGTKLANGVCALDTSGCGEGSTLTDGVCVADAPTGDECGDGTMFDSASGKCVPNEVIECGDNTMKVDGKCVPAGTVCTDGTMLNSDGQCVVAAPACSTGTQLDPNTGKCSVTDQVCDTNTAFDSASNTCKPTATVCATGTTFAADTQLCLPDATCQAGDVIVEGTCYSPSEALFQSTTVEGAENDDINLGGTANDITLPALGMKTSFKGIIDVPTDLDNDGTPDQDLDVYKITGTAGQHISIDLQAIGGPSMSFAVFGPNNYERFAPLALKRGAKRSIVLPWDGEYYIAVAPALVIANDEAGPIGESTWRYVAEIETLPAPTPVDVNTDNANITGTYADLSDNLYKITNYTSGEIVDVTIKGSGKNAEGAIQVWSSPTNYVSSFPVGDVDDTFSVVLPAGDAFLFVDWINANGPALDYEIEVKAKPGQEALGTLAPGGTASTTAQDLVDNDIRFFTVTLAAGEVLGISHTNDENRSVRLEVRDNDGNTTLNSTFNAAGATTPEYEYIYSPTGGTYVIEVEATGNNTNFVLTANSITPIDAGTLAAGSTNAAPATALPSRQAIFYKVGVAAGEVFEYSQTNAEDESIWLRLLNAADGEQVRSITSFNPENVTSPSIGYEWVGTGNTYIVRLQNDSSTDKTNVVFNHNSLTPADGGTFNSMNQAINLTNAALLADERSTFYTVTFTDDAKVEGTISATGAGAAAFTYYDATTGGSLGSFTDDVNIITIPAGTYLFGIEATTELDQGFALNLTTNAPPASEVEPNDSVATATPVVFPFEIVGTGGWSMNNDREFTSSNVPFDYYTFTLAQDMPASDSLSLTLDSIASVDPSSGPYMIVEDAMGNEVGRSGTSGLNKTLSLSGLTAGTYTIQIAVSFVTGFNTQYLLKGTELTFPYSSAPALGLAIVDNDAAVPISNVINVPDACIITDILINVDITHTYRGDILLDVTSPTGTKLRLWDGSGGGADDLIGAFGVSLTPNVPLSGFFTEEAMGNWTIEVADDGFGDTGTLNNWALSFTCQ